MNAAAVRFDWSLNLGHVLTIVSVLGGFAIGIGTYVSKVASIEHALAANHERATRYAPLIDEAIRVNGLQDERLLTLTAMTHDMKRVQTDMAAVLGTLREDMAQVRAKMALDRGAPR